MEQYKGIMMIERINLFSDYLALEGKSTRTINAYRLDLNQFHEFVKRFFEDDEVPVEAITVLNIRDFLRHLNELQDCNRSLARKSAALNSFFRFCKRKSYISANPMDKIKRPKYEKPLPKCFTEDEVRNLLAIPDVSSPFGVRNRAILETIYSCGLSIPDDLSVGAFDIVDSTGLMKLNITTVLQPAEDIGVVAADLCLQPSGHEGIKLSRRLVLDHQFFENDTVKAL